MSTTLYLFKKGENQTLPLKFIHLLERNFPEFIFQKYQQIKHKNYKLDFCLVRIVLLYALKERGFLNLREHYEHTEEGKPFLKDVPLFFSLSHSSEYIGVAVSTCEIGLDVEKNKNFNFRRISTFLTDLENVFLENNPDKFYELWTQKEAIVKLEGTTLSQMRDYCVVKNADNYNFYFSDEEDYKICLALKNQTEIEVKKISMAEISSAIL